MTLYRRIVVISVGVLVLLSIFISVRSIVSAKPVMADFNELPTIIIDPGHGGLDGGAVANGVVEKDVNLAIGLVLRDMFAASGFEVVMTRESDVSIHDEGISTVRKQKTSDLKNRLKLADSQPNAVFISVHQNKFGQASSKGTQVFYGPKNTGSKRLAEILQQEFVAQLQPENHRKSKKADKNLFLMYEAQCPAVLVECGFLSNPGDAASLSDEAYQSKVAFVTFCSVMRYLGLEEHDAQ